MPRIFHCCIALLLFASIAIGEDEKPTNVVAGKKVDADATIKVGDKLVG